MTRDAGDGVGQEAKAVRVARGGGRLMGLDLGEKTIGIAVSDELGWTAQPHRSLRRKTLAQDLEVIRACVEEKGVSGVVVGLPRNMDGTLGPKARWSQRMADRLEAFLGIPVVCWDERLTTVAAERVLIEADLSRARRKRHVDKIAAALILQCFLEAHGGTGAGAHGSKSGEEEPP